MFTILGGTLPCPANRLTMIRNSPICGCNYLYGVTLERIAYCILQFVSGFSSRHHIDVFNDQAGVVADSGVIPQRLVDEAFDAGEVVVVEDDESAGFDVAMPVFKIVADAFVRMVGIDEQDADGLAGVLARPVIGSANERGDATLMTGLLDALGEFGIGAATETGDGWIRLPEFHRAFKGIDCVDMSRVALLTCGGEIAGGQTGPRTEFNHVAITGPTQHVVINGEQLFDWHHAITGRPVNALPKLNQPAQRLRFEFERVKRCERVARQPEFANRTHETAGENMPTGGIAKRVIALTCQ